MCAPMSFVLVAGVINMRAAIGMDGMRVASPRFELGSGDPESPMIDHYTTRLSVSPIHSLFIIFFELERLLQTLLRII